MRSRSGYRAGVLIERIALDLRDFEFTIVAPDRADFRSRSGDVRFNVRELLESHLLMHIASAEFIVRCPSRCCGRETTEIGAIVARHRGSLRRKGIEYRVSPAASDAARRLRDALSRSAELTAALMPLDFTHCRFNLAPRHVEMRVRHYGACEIVGRLPKFRRYVRLGAEQRESLLSVFRAFGNIIQC
jgi:hypothetical protein